MSPSSIMLLIFVVFFGCGALVTNTVVRAEEVEIQACQHGGGVWLRRELSCIQLRGRF